MAGGVALWSLNEVSRALFSVRTKYSHEAVLCGAVSVHVKERGSTPGATAWLACLWEVAVPSSGYA